jgi:hypothetical protein
MNIIQTSLSSFIIKRNQSSFPSGFANGYILLPPTHKYFGVDYDDIPVDVHGGLTFGEFVDLHLLEFWKMPSVYLGWYCVGFDTAHYNDSLDNWDKQAVINETLKLMQQLI